MIDIPFIVVAGGKGLRMGRHLPKQYIEIKGKPLIYYTFKNLKAAGVQNFILVINLSYKEYLEASLEDLDLSISYMQGGGERFDSVKNGLQALRDSVEWVAIHDGVRPLVSKDMLDRIITRANVGDVQCVIPVLPSKDTLKIIKGDLVQRTLDRSNIARVGTPQLVRVNDYLAAIDKYKDNMAGITDDSSLMEKMGFKVAVVPGEEQCFKITDEFDLYLFQNMIRRKI